MLKKVCDEVVFYQDKSSLNRKQKNPPPLPLLHHNKDSLLLPQSLCLAESAFAEVAISRNCNNFLSVFHQYLSYSVASSSPRGVEAAVDNPDNFCRMKKNILYTEIRRFSWLFKKKILQIKKSREIKFVKSPGRFTEVTDSCQSLYLLLLLLCFFSVRSHFLFVVLLTLLQDPLSAKFKPKRNMNCLRSEGQDS